MSNIKSSNVTFSNRLMRHKFSVLLLIVALVGSVYLYKCYTDPFYFKSELYQSDSIARCKVLSKYIPNGTSRQYAEKILVDSDGAKIEPNNPNSKGIEVGSVIYNLDPWVFYSSDSAYMYIWYDKNDKVIGMTGTHCVNDRRIPKL